MSAKKNKSSKKLKAPIYFDHNSTTLICDRAKEKYIDWLACYNPSSDTKLSKRAKEEIENVEYKILTHCSTTPDEYRVIFNSGATEGNCFILRACVKAAKKKLRDKIKDLNSGFIEIPKPHIVISAIEHYSIMECVEDLYSTGEIEYTKVNPTIFGNILPEDVRAAIKENTCLISIMAANNEIPIINNIRDIGQVAHEYKIPLHSDCVQLFGKYRMPIGKNNIDILTASAHKFYGPKGMGLLIISTSLIEAYGITAEINGSQQHGLRGGTENVPGILVTWAALENTFQNRKKKNEHLLALRNSFLMQLSSYNIKFVDYKNYVNFVSDESPSQQQPLGSQNFELTAEGGMGVNNNVLDQTEEDKPPLEFVSLGPPTGYDDFILCNTVLLAICKNQGKPFCNVVLKKYLDENGVAASIGSACMTAHKNASHVLDAIAAPNVVKRGVIRISFGDHNTREEIERAIPIIISGIRKQCIDIGL